MRHVRMILLAGSLAGIVATAGCGNSLKQSEDVMTAVRTYGDGLRWQRHAMAAGKLPPAERTEFLLERDELAEDLRINGYEVVSVEGGKDPNRTVIVLKYTWYSDGEGLVHDSYARQAWERHGKVWLLMREEHLRGDAMPGLPDPDPDADGADDGAMSGADEAAEGVAESPPVGEGTPGAQGGASGEGAAEGNADAE